MDNGHIVLIGNSLGSGVATEMATEMPVGGLILVSAFTSLPAVAARHLPYIPARLLIRDRFDNLSKMKLLQTGHVLILHGRDDTLIPALHAAALARATPGAALELVDGTGHELAYLPQAQAIIARWLGGLNKP